MANENLERIYHQVFNSDGTQAQELETGILYEMIQTFLRERPSEAMEICNYFEVRPDASRCDDQLILVNNLLISTPQHFQGVLKKFLEVLPQERRTMNWLILLGASALIGLYLSYIQSRRQQRSEIQEVEARQLNPPVSTTSADLCLVVPALIVSNLSNGSNLRVDEVKEIIDNSSYFLCANPEDTKLNEKYLETVDEDIPPNSKKEVYVRIRITEADRGIVNQKIPYAIKTNLSNRSQYIVQRLICLRDLSGLEAFNRV